LEATRSGRGLWLQFWWCSGRRCSARTRSRIWPRPT